MSSSVPREYIEKRICLIRESKVMLDSDLEAPYDVETGALNRAFKRNRDRFPADVAFQLATLEKRYDLQFVACAPRSLQFSSPRVELLGGRDSPPCGGTRIRNNSVCKIRIRCSNGCVRTVGSHPPPPSK